MNRRFYIVTIFLLALGLGFAYVATSDEGTQAPAASTDQGIRL